MEDNYGYVGIDVDARVNELLDLCREVVKELEDKGIEVGEVI